MPETIKTVRETAKTDCILREKAVRANLAIDYDIDSGKYVLDTKQCPYWLAKFFGKRGDGAFVIHQVRNILTAISRGAETPDEAVDKTVPNTGYDCTYTFGEWFGEVSYDAFGSAGRAYEAIKNNDKAQSVDFEGICRSGFEKYMIGFARELFAAMKG